MGKHNLRPGYKWCDVCQAGVPGSICIKHELDRPVTLNRYDAKTLYDLALKMGHKPAGWDISEQAEVIKELVRELAAGNYTLARQVKTPSGIEWQVIP